MSFGLMSFGLMSFGLVSHSAILYVVRFNVIRLNVVWHTEMSFGLLSVYPIQSQPAEHFPISKDLAYTCIQGERTNWSWPSIFSLLSALYSETPASLSSNKPISCQKLREFFKYFTTKKISALSSFPPHLCPAGVPPSTLLAIYLLEI